MRHAIPFSISFLKLTTNRDFFSLMLSTFMGELRLMVGADNLITYSPKLKNIRGYPPIVLLSAVNRWSVVSKMTRRTTVKRMIRNAFLGLDV